MLNYYTIFKIKNLFKQLSKVDKDIFLELLSISNEKAVEFGEPYYINKSFSINGMYYQKSFKIRIKKKFLTKRSLILTLKYKGDIYSKKSYKLNEKESLIDSIKKFLNNVEYQSIPNKSEFIDTINEMRNLDEGWNGYACNSISINAVDNCLEYYNKLCEYLPYYDIQVCPQADSGNVHRQPIDSNSGCVIEMWNNKEIHHKRTLEIEFNKNMIDIYGYSMKWNENKGDYDYIHDLPLDKADIDENIYLKNFNEIIPYLCWAYPNVASIIREKTIKMIIN